MVPPSFASASRQKPRQVRERSRQPQGLAPTPILQPLVTEAASGSVYWRSARSTGYSGIFFHRHRRRRIPATRLSSVAFLCRVLFPSRYQDVAFSTIAKQVTCVKAMCTLRRRVSVARTLRGRDGEAWPVSAHDYSRRLLDTTVHAGGHIVRHWYCHANLRR